MGYPINLDEIPTISLQHELARRMKLREAEKCDYCERPCSDPVCRFPNRHYAVHQDTEPMTVMSASVHPSKFRADLKLMGFTANQRVVLSVVQVPNNGTTRLIAGAYIERLNQPKLPTEKQIGRTYILMNEHYKLLKFDQSEATLENASGQIVVVLLNGEFFYDAVLK